MALRVQLQIRPCDEYKDSTESTIEVSLSAPGQPWRQAKVVQTKVGEDPLNFPTVEGTEFSDEKLQECMFNVEELQEKQEIQDAAHGHAAEEALQADAEDDSPDCDQHDDLVEDEEHIQAAILEQIAAENEEVAHIMCRILQSPF